ncbi:MAG: hypothetical protein P8127_07635 [Acidobacteriota bacterium]|jgi:hypothetical protein
MFRLDALPVAYPVMTTRPQIQLQKSAKSKGDTRELSVLPHLSHAERSDDETHCDACDLLPSYPGSFTDTDDIGRQADGQQHDPDDENCDRFVHWSSSMAAT